MSIQPSIPERPPSGSIPGESTSSTTSRQNDQKNETISDISQHAFDLLTEAADRSKSNAAQDIRAVMVFGDSTSNVDTSGLEETLNIETADPNAAAYDIIVDNIINGSSPDVIDDPSSENRRIENQQNQLNQLKADMSSDSEKNENISNTAQTSRLDIIEDTASNLDGVVFEPLDPPPGSESSPRNENKMPPLTPSTRERRNSTYTHMLSRSDTEGLWKPRHPSLETKRKEDQPSQLKADMSSNSEKNENISNTAKTSRFDIIKDTANRVVDNISNTAKTSRLNIIKDTASRVVDCVKKYFSPSKIEEVVSFKKNVDSLKEFVSHVNDKIGLSNKASDLKNQVHAYFKKSHSKGDSDATKQKKEEGNNYPDESYFI